MRLKLKVFLIKRSGHIAKRKDDRCFTAITKDTEATEAKQEYQESKKDAGKRDWLSQDTDVCREKFRTMIKLLLTIYEELDDNPNGSNIN